MDDRLSIVLTTADGHLERFGPDEPNAEDIPQSLSFSTAIPGAGFKDAQFSLTSPIDRERLDLEIFDNVRIHGAGNETAWEGRVHQLPRKHGEDFSIEVGAVGWSAHLKDDPSFKEIYVDQDKGRWGPVSTQRRINLLASYGVSDPTVQPDPATGEAALKTAVTGPWSTTPGRPRAEALYDAGPGIDIGSVYYAWKRASNIDNTNANWAWQVVLGTDDLFTSTDSTGSLRAAGPGTGTLSATDSRRAAFVYLDFANVAGGQDNVEYPIFWTALAVYGDHGLTKQGTASATGAQGFYGSDVVADVVSRAAPLLTYTTGDGGSIEPTSFVIPQLAFPDPTDASEVIDRVNAYHLYEWGVYEDRQFFFRQPDPDRLCWEARTDQGLEYDFEGDDAENLFNGVIVSYTDPNGQQKTAGPPGSGCDDESSALEDTSETNPVNAHGLGRRWGQLSVSQVTTAGSSGGAVQIGYVWLAEHSLPQRKGTLVLRPRLNEVPMVQHPAGGTRPLWKIRAGDFVRVGDFPADVPRRIVSTRYDHGSRTMTLDVDNASTKLDAILERIGIALVGIT